MKAITRKLIYTAVVLLMGATFAYAQPTYTVSPPSFTAEDEITITVDVTNTSLKDHAGDVWMWAWISEGCSSGCDAPTNIDPAGAANTEAAKMTRVSANVYSITFVPSVFYNKPPSEIKRIGFKLKSASWSDNKQTDSDVLINVDPLVFTPRVNRVFPTKVTKDDIVTLYLDQKEATSPDLKYAVVDFTVTVTAYDSDGDEIGSLEDVATKKEGNGLHYLRIMPTYNFNSSEVTSIKYRFSSTTTELQSDEFELVFFEQQ